MAAVEPGCVCCRAQVYCFTSHITEKEPDVHTDKDEHAQPDDAHTTSAERVNIPTAQKQSRTNSSMIGHPIVSTLVQCQPRIDPVSIHGTQAHLLALGPNKMLSLGCLRRNMAVKMPPAQPRIPMGRPCEALGCIMETWLDRYGGKHKRSNRFITILVIVPDP